MSIKLFSFLKGIIDISVLYRSLKPHMSFIIVDIFPKAMAITPEELKLWEEDPIQFVTRIYDVYYEFTNVRMEAGNFLSYLSKVRANDILSLFLNFMTQTFDAYNNSDPSQRDYLSKEWMLYALELLAPNLLSKDGLKESVVGRVIWCVVWCPFGVHLMYDVRVMKIRSVFLRGNPLT